MSLCTLHFPLCLRAPLEVFIRPGGVSEPPVGKHLSKLTSCRWLSCTNTSATIRPWRYKALVTPTLQSVFMQQRWCERFNFLRCIKINGSLGALWMDWQFLWCSLVIRTIESAHYQTGITFHEAKEWCTHKWNPCCLFRVHTDKKMCSRTALLDHPVYWLFVRSAANRSHNILTLRKWG